MNRWGGTAAASDSRWVCTVAEGALACSVMDPDQLVEFRQQPPLPLAHEAPTPRVPSLIARGNADLLFSTVAAT